MTYLAIEVLRQSRPMAAEEITHEAIDRGLIAPHGKTPATAMRARLYIHARKATQPLIRREFETGRQRAIRSSVRWLYVG